MLFLESVGSEACQIEMKYEQIPRNHYTPYEKTSIFTQTCTSNCFICKRNGKKSNKRPCKQVNKLLLYNCSF